MFDILSPILLKASDYYALREEYANEDESYFRYMLANDLRDNDKANSKKSA